MLQLLPVPVLTGGQPSTSIPALPWDDAGASGKGRARCAPGGQGKLQAAGTVPWKRCHGGESSLNPTWHSFCSSGALAPAWTRPAARVGCARLAAAGAPARPRAMARSAAAPR